MWVRYENGHEAPLEPKLGAGFMTQLGYDFLLASALKSVGTRLAYQ